jgi:vesicle-fusing ATPase
MSKSKSNPLAEGKQSISMSLKVSSISKNSLALTNQVYLNPNDANFFASHSLNHSVLPQTNYVKVKDWVYIYAEDPAIPKGGIGLSGPQRRFMELSFNDFVNVTVYQTRRTSVYLSYMKLEVDLLAKSTSVPNVDAKKLEETLRRNFVNHIFTKGQKFVAEVDGVTLVFTVTEVHVVNIDNLKLLDESSDQKNQKNSSKREPKRGVFTRQTEVEFSKTSAIKISGASVAATTLFHPDFNFEKMGIGGLNKEISDIFRRAFASRVFPYQVIAKLGIKHVRGLLLYGPPGTGKTLIARQIAKMLNAREPKLVSGPEILNKYVGQSEENIRNLFKDAEAEYKLRKDESDLHIIIFDELDAICRERGTRSTGGTGVGDSVVNQLLAKLDGVEELNNILVIGMTNRKELIDEALLRPGRLEVHMEIGLPDEEGRLQILRIHTKTMRESGLLDPSVKLEEIAQLTKNYSGAELEGLVRSASSFALQRQIDPNNPVRPVNPEAVRVIREDFMCALQEVKPSFGVSEESLEACITNGIINFGASFAKLWDTVKSFLIQVRNSNRTPLISVLLEGPTGSGKSAISAKLAMESAFPFVKVLSPENLVTNSESGKCYKIIQTFEDAYKSKLSLIIVDDIERLLDYAQIGPRFSNAVLQTLLVLLKKSPPKGRKLLVIGTTSQRELLKQLEFMDVFNAVLNVPPVTGGCEVRKVLEELGGFSKEDLDVIETNFQGTIPIKKLIMIAEMALQSKTNDTLLKRFVQCMQDYGIPTSFDDRQF